ncbi:MAG: neutral/alkaline non-lysosomal ceramidase N-terminal domain-containing protein [Anaerolineae bacterium]|nr:neutral/alkaline non-lysosomal ceramidase N-terminal domain-containing protein [Anaerolineae bacterium]
MRAGAAQGDITPPVGSDLTGYVARLGSSVGIHDALHARALVLEDDDTRAVIVTCDLLALGDATVLAAREAIATALGTVPGLVMLACTHTHSGPATVFLHQCGEVDPTYVGALPERLADVAAMAAARLQSVRVAAGWGALPEGAFNRRGAGPEPDTSVGVVQLKGLDGAPVATLMTYGCHPVVMGPESLLVSADYPGAAVGAVERALGGAALFLTGASGDVNPRRRGSFGDVAWLGERVAEEAVRLAARLDAGAEGRITVASEVLNLPLTTPPDGAALDDLIKAYALDLREAEATGEPIAIRIARAMLGWAESLAVKTRTGKVSSTVAVEIQAIGLGPAVFVGVPGELFSGLGAQIKAVSGNVFVVGYTNGDVGYIPDREAYVTGGYEVSDAFKYYDAPAALAPEAGEMVVAAARRVCERTARCSGR